MDVIHLLKQAVQLSGSDIFMVPGSMVNVKINGVFHAVSEEKLMPKQSEEILKEIYRIADRSMSLLYEMGDDDFSFALSGIGRFRCNAFKQRNSLAAVLRVVTFGLPDPKEMNIPQEVMDVTKEKNGLVLITGPAGSGKSTTLACLIDEINQHRQGHIITIEDPIEYIHPHKMSIVSQREVAHDTESYRTALRASLRQAPDVILLGEMRDYETIQTTLTAGETGHLVFSTLHTIGAAKTIDRIIDVFDASQQAQVRVQLSMVLRAVISQQLIPSVNGELVPAFEIMKVTPAIANMIRESKSHQMDNVISSRLEGMRTMDMDILRLYEEGIITKENALLYSTNPSAMEKKINH